MISQFIHAYAQGLNMKTITILFIGVENKGSMATHELTKFIGFPRQRLWQPQPLLLSLLRSSMHTTLYKLSFMLYLSTSKKLFAFSFQTSSTCPFVFHFFPFVSNLGFTIFSHSASPSPKLSLWSMWSIFLWLHSAFHAFVIYPFYSNTFLL